LFGEVGDVGISESERCEKVEERFVSRENGKTSRPGLPPEKHIEDDRMIHLFFPITLRHREFIKIGKERARDAASFRRGKIRFGFFHTNTSLIKIDNRIFAIFQRGFLRALPASVLRCIP
jgi:hypothetical protein